MSLTETRTCTVCDKSIWGSHPKCAGQRRMQLLAELREQIAAGNPPYRYSWIRHNDHLKRARLSNGWFIDHDRLTGFRQRREHPYSLWAPGQDPGGCALFVRSARSLKALMEVAE